jgi:hypothetical protein
MIRRVGRTIAKGALWLVTGLVPVVIAACYGAYYGFQRGGRVADATSRQGVGGIRVTCRVGDRVTSQAVSRADGWYSLTEDQPCDEVLFEDVDGAENGSYLPASVPAPPAGDVNVELRSGK